MGFRRCNRAPAHHPHCCRVEPYIAQNGSDISVGSVDVYGRHRYASNHGRSNADDDRTSYDCSSHDCSAANHDGRDVRRLPSDERWNNLL